MGAALHAPPDPPGELELDLLLHAVERLSGRDLHAWDRDVVRRRVQEARLREGVGSLSALQERVLHVPGALARLLSALRPPGAPLLSETAFLRAFRGEVVPRLRTWPSVRVWHAGCGTGELSYALALVLAEEGLLGRASLYATEEDPAALAVARTGVYPARGLAALDRASGGRGRLRPHLALRGGRAAVSAELRGAVYFAEHSLATDGSFNEFQAVVWRGALHDYGLPLRARALRVMAESLVPFGVLALGEGETPAGTPAAEQLSPGPAPCFFVRLG